MSGAAKRKISDMMTVQKTTSPPKTAKKRLMLGFADEEKVNRVSNEDLPLVSVAGIRGHNVVKCLVDEGNSIDILYQDAFEKLGLKKGDLKAYSGMKLHRFDGTRTCHWGYVDLDVTVIKGMGEQTEGIFFLVVPLKSVYNYILGNPTLAVLDAVTSTVYLKVKYHRLKGDMITIHAEIKGAKKCLLAGEKVTIDKTTPTERRERTGNATSLGQEMPLLSNDKHVTETSRWPNLTPTPPER